MTCRYPRCIMATAVIPWDERGEFVEDLFRHEVRTLLGGLTKHLYLFGTAGEGYAVSDRQFDRIVRVFQEEMKAGGAEAMVGIINLSLSTIVERIAHGRELGVRKFQISLPSWGALTETEIFSFFQHTCGKFRDCQFMHYNLPRTKRIVTGKEYGRLASENPNLVATKNCTDSITRIEELLTYSPQLRHFLGESGYAYGSLIGEFGLLASTVVTNHKSAQAFFEAGIRRDGETLLSMQRELEAYARDFIGLVDNGAHIDGTFDKMLWKLSDPRFPLRLLPPYQHSTDEIFQKFRTLLKERYPRWSPS